MGLKDVLGSSVFVRVVLVLWVVSSVVIVFLLGMIDGIVHIQLYQFGLQFSYDWAVPYWGFMRMVYLCLIVPSVLSVVGLVFGVFGRGGGEVPVVKTVEVKPAVVPKVQQSLKEVQNHMVASCPSCKRVFTKPLVMLDFSSGKTRLVNVCPYCNHILGGADEGEKSMDEIAVRDLEQERVEEK
jgi:hypothetical protein